MSKTRFVCSSCGYESGKWLGRCPECSSWNSLLEVSISDEKGKTKKKKFETIKKPTRLGDIKKNVSARISTGFEEFDRVLGGGIVEGPVVLLSGDPGIGKSTLLLEVALNLAKREGKSVLYISGEESEDQLGLRAQRLMEQKSSLLSNLYVFSGTNIDQVLETIKEQKPSLVILDSIQTMESEDLSSFPGSLPQVRYATSSIIELAKRENIPIFLVGHVTKEGVVAGPMLLSHMVDVVLYLEGEQFSGTRILRAFKNRFGDATEVGIFIMEERGLIEIKDASSFFIDKRNDQTPGNCITVLMEGSRPILAEIQALTVASSLSFPRRVVSGLNERRVELLLAVVQKHNRLPLDRTDVFLNVVGGLKILETACDLAVCLAIISSFRNKPLVSTIAISEVGLLGELRPVVNLQKRISEARKFGYKHILTHKDYSYLNYITKDIINS